MQKQILSQFSYYKMSQNILPNGIILKCWYSTTTITTTYYYMLGFVTIYTPVFLSIVLF